MPDWVRILLFWLAGLVGFAGAVLLRMCAQKLFPQVACAWASVQNRMSIHQPLLVLRISMRQLCPPMPRIIPVTLMGPVMHRLTFSSWIAVVDSAASDSLGLDLSKICGCPQKDPSGTLQPA